MSDKRIFKDKNNNKYAINEYSNYFKLYNLANNEMKKVSKKALKNNYKKIK